MTLQQPYASLMPDGQQLPFTPQQDGEAEGSFERRRSRSLSILQSREYEENGPSSETTNS